MSGNYSPMNETSRPLDNERGSSTSVLLLVLLLVAAAAGYLYFFTDIIIPHKEAVSPPPQPVQVKQPLPPRPGQPDAAQPGQAEAPKQGEAPPAAPAAAAPPVKPAPAPAPQAKGEPAQKPAPAPAPAKPEPVKASQAAAPVKPAEPAAAAPKAQPMAPAAAPVPPKQAAAPVAQAAKKAPAPATTVRKGEKKKGGPYRLLVGDFGPGKELASVEAKLKKSGIAPVRKTVVTAAEPMNRLFVAKIDDQVNAEAELGKVKKISGDAFLVADKDGYLLYGGSFLSPDRAAAVQKKLASRGVTSVIRKVKVSVRVTRVTAGSYASSNDAGKDAGRLKKQGIRATVIKLK